MSVKLDAFPKIDMSLMAKIGVQSAPLSFSYHEGGGIVELTEEHEEAVQSPIARYRISGPAWHPESCDLQIAFGMRIGMPRFLFGPGGVASAHGASIGIGIRWIDSTASVRGAFPLGEITAEKSAEPVEITGSRIWLPGDLRGMLVLQAVAYLLNRGNPGPDERHFARVSGTILGCLHESEVVIDGSGAIFPVRHVSLPGEPLWNCVCDWVDPIYDPFTDSTFCLNLNTAHPDYELLQSTDDKRMTPLFREVLAGALHILLTRVLADSSRDAIADGTDLEEGTIAAMAHYLISTFDLPVQPDRPEYLSSALHRMVGKAFT